MNVSFIILAAGKGTRMNNDLPKVLHEICGKTLISYVLRGVSEFNSKQVIAITSPDLPEVDHYMSEKYPQTKITHQKERLGTGHAVKLALPALPESGVTIVLYGDTPFISKQTIDEIIKRLKTCDICILGFNAANPKGYGRLILNKEGNLVEIIEEKEASEKQKSIKLCNSGVMGFNNKNIGNLIKLIKNNNSKKEYYLTDAVKIARSKNLKAGYVITTEEEVIGVNSQVERASAEIIRQNYLRKKHMENGVILIAPETTFFSEETKISAGAIIHPYCIFKGGVTVAKNTEIFAFSYLEDCSIASDVRIGPYARIRPQSKLQKGSRIGNFVEIKNSVIGDDSKINHLSYIGDSEIGKNVNIGAGTITCNYDGKNKYKTVVAEGAFIGSNSSLVAPVKVGKEAIIGAGTTLFEDAPAGKITINQMPIKNLKKKK